MDYTEFSKFQERFGYGSGNKDIDNKKVKEVNEKIHSKQEEYKELSDKKKRDFIMSDWESSSERYISMYTWDVGKGEFVTLGNLQIELNKTK